MPTPSRANTSSEPMGVVIESEEQAYQFMATNPHFSNAFKRMIKEGIAEEAKATQPKGKSAANTAEQSKIKTNLTKPKRRDMTVIPKSPSDTTLYTPALKKIPSNTELDSNEMLQKISNFVEEIRISSNPGTPKTATPAKFVRGPGQQVDAGASNSNGNQPRNLDEEQQMDERPQQRESQADIETERFDATVEASPGKGDRIKNVVDRQYEDEDDDEFFHLACHVDAGLKTKIQKGEFVELERLLPKKNSFRGDEGCLEWITKDGMTFLAPVQEW